MTRKKTGKDAPPPETSYRWALVVSEPKPKASRNPYEAEILAMGTTTGTAEDVRRKCAVEAKVRQDARRALGEGHGSQTVRYVWLGKAEA